MVRISSMSNQIYRTEDQFQEVLNAQILKDFFNRSDYSGLLEFALLLNKRSSMNSSRAHYALLEASKK